MPRGYKLNINIEEFKKLYAELRSIAKVAKILGCGERPLRTFAKNNNLLAIRKNLRKSPNFYKKPTIEILERFKELYKEFKSIEKVAKILGCGLGTLRQFAKQNNLTIKDKNSVIDLEEFKKLYIKHKSIGKVAKILKCNLKRLIKFIKENNISTKDKIPILNLEEFKKLHLKFRSIKQMSKILGCSTYVLTNFAKRNNIIIGNGSTPLMDLEEFNQLYKSLGTLKQVAEVTSHIYQTLSTFAKKNGIDVNRHFCTYYYDPLLFTKDDEETFYWAGFIAADGCVSKPKNASTYTLSIALAVKDLSHLEKFKLFTKSDVPISMTDKYHKTKYPRCTIQLCSNEIFNNLARFNIVPRKSLIYAFPSWLREHPLVNHFIRGYIDGDGCFSFSNTTRSSNKKSLSIAGTFDCMSSIEQIIKKNCALDYNKKITSLDNIFTLNYSGVNIVPKIANFLYKDATIYLERKYDKAYAIPVYKIGGPGNPGPRSTKPSSCYNLDPTLNPQIKFKSKTVMSDIINLEE